MNEAQLYKNLEFQGYTPLEIERVIRKARARELEGLQYEATKSGLESQIGSPTGRAVARGTSNPTDLYWSSFGRNKQGSGVPEVPLGTEAQYMPPKQLSPAQLEANRLQTQYGRLQTQFEISKTQSQLAMQPLFAGVQRSILGKIGARVGAVPFTLPSQYQSPYSSVPYSTSIYGGKSYGWSNPSIVPQFPA